MACYTFTATTSTTVTGCVTADSEEEALEKISNGDVDDIFDSDESNDYYNAEIINCDSDDDEGEEDSDE